MHQIPLITYHINYNSCFSYCLVFLVLFTVSITYQNLLLLSLLISIRQVFYQVLLSQQSLYQQLFEFDSISKPYQLSSSLIIYLHEAIVPCTCIKSLVTFRCQLHLSLTSFCFPNNILVPGIPVSCSSVTTQFLYSKLPSYQLLLSAITIYLLHHNCSGYIYRYSFQLFLSVTPSYFYQLLLSATRNRQSLLLLRYYSLLYQLLF